MKLTPGQIEEILTQHSLWLDTEGQQGCQADLTKADLTKADLTEANLRYADLTGARLAEADLTKADLRYADLTGARLAEADLTRARLAEADLTEANLTGAKLAEANLTEANLTKANLTKANLTRARLAEADLTGANLSYTCVIGFYVCRYFGFYHGDYVKIGCESHSLDHWLKHYKDIGQAHGYSPAEIEAIGMQLRTIKRQAKLLEY